MNIIFGEIAVLAFAYTRSGPRDSPQSKRAAYETDDYKQTTPFASTLRAAISKKILVTLMAHGGTRNFFARIQ
jgi:hypothetical protein